MKESCRCRLKCGEKINDVDRALIFACFWDRNKSSTQKAQYIASIVKEKPTARSRPRNNAQNQRRQNTKCYSFEVRGSVITVCKVFFINTLSIGEKFVSVALEEKGSRGAYITWSTRKKGTSK